MFASRLPLISLPFVGVYLVSWWIQLDQHRDIQTAKSAITSYASNTSHSTTSSMDTTVQLNNCKKQQSIFFLKTSKVKYRVFEQNYGVFRKWRNGRFTVRRVTFRNRLISQWDIPLRIGTVLRITKYCTMEYIYPVKYTTGDIAEKVCFTLLFRECKDLCSFNRI